MIKPAMHGAGFTRKDVTNFRRTSEHETITLYYMHRMFNRYHMHRRKGEKGMKTDFDSLGKYRASLSGMSMKKLECEFNRKRGELAEMTRDGSPHERSEESQRLRAEIQAITSEIRNRRGKHGPADNRQVRG